MFSDFRILFPLRAALAAMALSATASMAAAAAPADTLTLSLDDAIADLAAEMGYSKYQVVDYPSREANFMEILSSIAGYSDYARVRALREELGQAYPLYQDIRRLQTLDPIQARMERTVIF